MASDTFLGFTATAWTALGSIGGAISIGALSLFNYWYLGAVKRAATASEDQAKSARDSLTALRGQLAEQQIRYEASAIEALKALSRTCWNWEHGINKDHEGGPISLTPSTWISVRLLVSTQMPHISEAFSEIESGIERAEGGLNKHMQRPVHARGVISPETTTLVADLSKVAVDASALAEKIGREFRSKST